MRFPSFIGGAYTLRSLNADCQRCVNLYPEINEARTAARQEVGTLNGTPGLKLLISTGKGECRGLYASMSGRLFAVVGRYVFEVVGGNSWTTTTLGTMRTSTGACSMSDNGNDLIIVDGFGGYDYSFREGTFKQITDQNFHPSDNVEYIDTYMMFNWTGTGKFFFSGLLDTTFDGADVGEMESNWKRMVGLIVAHREVWFFGPEKTEVWFDTGDGSNPFQPIQGAFIEYGACSPHANKKIDNSIVWLSKGVNGEGIVLRVSGYQPTRISTHAIEDSLDGLDLSEASAWTYQQDGHHFYCLNVPGLPTTWCYDTSTGLWHERIFLNNGKEERHRVSCHAFAFNTHVVGDYENGDIYALDQDTYTDNGSPIMALRSSPHAATQGLNLVYWNTVQLDMETGIGLDGTQQGTNPQVMLQWSNDAGHTWSNEHWRSAGKMGGYLQRVIWRRLGISRNRVIRLKITDPVKRTLLGLEIDIKGGNS